MKRKNKLYVGEIVFDYDKFLFGVITAINGGEYKLDMTAKGTIKPYFDCESENRAEFDCEIADDELQWTSDNADSLYQIAWGIVDSRLGQLVCYEHNHTEDEYPYYSPYLDEKLFKFETINLKENTRIKVFNIDYDTDGEKVDLPKSLIIDISEKDIDDLDDIECWVADWVSDATGFCVFGCDYEFID